MEPVLDVTSLYRRRAVNRWERTSVGDLLERVTWSHPDKEATVAGDSAYADARFRRTGADPTPEELIMFSGRTLAGYEAPKDVIFVDTLPETVGGKMLKYKLRAGHADHFSGARP